MSRPLRIEYPGAAYHVMSRGVNRQCIFRGEDEYGMFLRMLGHVAQDHRLQILSYCLMPNHFHLYLRTPEANLSRAMQVLLTLYATGKNRLEQRNGHLFQGRFRCHLVEEPGYGHVVSRYVHLNPVRGKSAIGMPITERRRVLRDYQWSSYGAIIGLRGLPGWVNLAGVLGGFDGKSLRKRQDKYARYVEQGLMKHVENPFEAAAAQCILGTDAFVDKIRRMHLKVVEKLSQRRELGQNVRLGRWVAFEEAQAIVAHAYCCKPESLLSRGQYDCEARQVLMYLSWRFCRGRHRTVELASKFNVGLGGYDSARQRLRARMAKDPTLSRRVELMIADLMQKQDK